MRVFKNRWFSRWAHDEGISDANLRIAAAEVAAGKVEADLGGYLFKKRVARAGGGKSGGYRTLVGSRRGDTNRIIFFDGFAKSQRANIPAKEGEALSAVAEVFLMATVNRWRN